MAEDKLVDRLRGKDTVGPNAEFGTRSFADFVPPISLEAANRIENLEKEIAAQYDRIETLLELLEDSALTSIGASDFNN
jgi:hypothetical protein